MFCNLEGLLLTIPTVSATYTSTSSPVNKSSVNNSHFLISTTPPLLAALQSSLSICHVQDYLLLSPSPSLLQRSSSVQVTNPFQSRLLADCCRHYPLFPCPTLLSSYALPSAPTHLKLPLATLYLRTLFPAPFLP